jgi:predicted small lipoprotein YifL
VQNLILASSLLCCLWLTACCATSGPLALSPMPKPVLPRITEQEAEQIRPDTWRKLVQRDLQRKQYAEQLEIVVEGCSAKGLP